MADNTPREDNTTITYFASDGRVVPDSTEATEALIKESVRGVEVRRTYATVNGKPQWQPPREVRAEPDVTEDPVKNTWDLMTSDGGVFHLVNTLEDLLVTMEWDSLPPQEQRKQVANMRHLPSWKAAPARLRTQVDAWLSAKN